MGLKSIRQQSIAWLLRVDHEDLSLQIPIEMNWNPSTFTHGVHMAGGPSILLIILESVYLLCISRCVQSALQYSIYGGGQDMTRYGNQLDDEVKFYTQFPVKSLRDATNQALSMKSRADLIRFKEQENKGLVIEKAWYYVDGCCCDWKTNHQAKERIPCFIDVTIPLQFWVQESRLVLAPGSKSCLLGFCDLNRTCPTRRNKEGQSQRVNGSSSSSKGLFHRLCQWVLNDSWSQPNPIQGDCTQPRFLISVQYQFNGKQFQRTYNDEVEICLPVSLAREVI
jgi:hypothetical protein